MNQLTYFLNQIEKFDIKKFISKILQGEILTLADLSRFLDQVNPSKYDGKFLKNGTYGSPNTCEEGLAKGQAYGWLGDIDSALRSLRLKRYDPLER